MAVDRDCKHVECLVNQDKGSNVLLSGTEKEAKVFIWQHLPLVMMICDLKVKTAFSVDVKMRCQYYVVINFTI